MKSVPFLSFSALLAILMLLFQSNPSAGQETTPETKGEAVEKVPKEGVLLYRKYKINKSISVQQDDFKKLLIRNGAGKVEVVQGNAGNIVVEAEATLLAKSRKAAEYGMNHFLNLNFKKCDDKIVLNSRFRFYSPKESKKDDKCGNLEKWEVYRWTKTPIQQVNIKVMVPEGMDVVLQDGSGDIEINGLAQNSLKVIDGSGSISIEGVKTNLHLRDGSGSIAIKNSTGAFDIRDGSGGMAFEQLSTASADQSIHISDGSGAILVAQCAGKMVIKDKSGGVALSDHNGDLEIKDRSGRLQVDGTKGSLTIADGSGNIELNNINQEPIDVESISIRDRSGSIEIATMEGNATIKDRSGPIGIEGLKGDLVINDHSGKISASKLDGNLKIKDNSGKIDANGNLKNLDIINRSGNVEVESEVK